jgi:hypothetical protein
VAGRIPCAIEFPNALPNASALTQSRTLTRARANAHAPLRAYAVAKFRSGELFGPDVQFLATHWQLRKVEFRRFHASNRPFAQIERAQAATKYVAPCPQRVGGGQHHTLAARAGQVGAALPGWGRLDAGHGLTFQPCAIAPCVGCWCASRLLVGIRIGIVLQSLIQGSGRVFRIRVRAWMSALVCTPLILFPFQ